jgi:class 3 adenylate cyclase
MNPARFLAKLARAKESDAVILVGDSAGFSRRTHEKGIVEALKVVAQGYRLMAPVLNRKGRIFSQKVDNVLAIFDDAHDAVAAALECQRRLRRERAKGRTEFAVCIGIDAGPVIRVGADVFGSTVNVAAKIGEDLAARDEILVTTEVARRVKGRVSSSYSRSTELGGRHFELHKVPVPR